ncbi:tripartite tricarboxylate transporter TctB family protein [Frigidibacter oleivorans]|uniref:tripartite tricarboxylate transporter TctB family protein n=1 Tax=Frigidibacter oleivorans TaxID=2487129 RepID=UPI000F8D4F6D|nr:tripartite tricarboxylate transporter TctB family protein [Frigidibacter oleivorans]
MSAQPEKRPDGLPTLEAVRQAYERSRDRLLELGIALLLMGLGIVIAIVAARMPPSRFEPIGPGPVPLILGILLAVMSALAAAQTLRSLVRMPEGWRLRAPDPHRLVIVSAIVVYVAVMQWGVVRYDVLTAAFLLLTGLYLARFDPRQIVPMGAIAVVLAVGIQFVFTQVFVTALPGAY